MFTQLIRLAFAALAFFMAGLAAADTTIPITNPNFYSPSVNGDVIPGWTFTPYAWVTPLHFDVGMQPNVYSRPREVTYSTDYLLPSGVSTFASMTCFVCPAGPNNFNTLSQPINGLVYGKKYQLKFYTWGRVNTTYGVPFALKGFREPAPMQVSLGSEVSEPIADLFGPSNYSYFPNPWKERTVNFTYKDAASSALLKLTQFALGLGLPCVHCDPTENLYLTNVRLTQIAGAAPQLQVTKELGSARIADTDQFIVKILQNSTTVNATTNSTTLGGGSNVTAGSGTTGLSTLVSGTTYTITEAASGTANLARYEAALACTDATGASKTLALNTGFTLSDDEVITCKIKNTAKAPVLRLTKALGTAGRINNADQFTVLIQQRLSDVASGTSAGTGSSISAGTTGWTPLVAGTGYTLNEVMTAASISKLGRYTGEVSCSNTFADSPTSVPLVPGTAFTPTYGDVLDCTLTNKPTLATLAVTQKSIVTAPATFNPPVKFSYTGTNGWSLQQNSSTVLNVVTTGARQTLTALNVATTLSVAVPTTEAGWKIASIRCTDTNASVSTNPLPPIVLASSTTNSITIPASYVVAGAALQCAVIGSRMQ